MTEAAVALSLLALAGTVAALVRSAPARLLRDAREAREIADAIEADWHAERVHLTTFKAEITALSEAIEKKRRQVAAAESRVNRGAPTNGAGDPDLSQASPDELRSYWTGVARQRGLI